MQILRQWWDRLEKWYCGPQVAGYSVPGVASSADMVWRCRQAEELAAEALKERDELRRRIENEWGVAEDYRARLNAAVEDVERLQASLRAERSVPVQMGLSAPALGRLALLIEECTLVQHAAVKVIEVGSYDTEHKGLPQRMHLERAIGKLRAATELLLTAGDCRTKDVRVYHHRRSAELALRAQAAQPGENGSGQ